MMGAAFTDRANMIFEYYPLEGSMEAMKISKIPKPQTLNPKLEGHCARSMTEAWRRNVGELYRLLCHKI